jgi:hypothetical protein
VSVRSETEDTELRNWKKELEDRCDAHLRENPEYEIQKALGAGPLQPQGIKVRCFESIYSPGDWNVYRGVERITTFTGPGAHEKALGMVMDLSKKNA